MMSNMGKHVTRDLRVVTTIEELQQLSDEWNSLLDNSASSDNIFLRWEWMFTWTKHYLGSGRLQVLLVYREGNHLIGIAPFYVRTLPIALGLDAREMRFLGTEEVSSCHLDIIATETEKPSVILRVYDYLHQEGHRLWDILTLSEVPSESCSVDTWYRLVGDAGQVIEITAASTCPVIDLPVTSTELSARISRNERYDLQRKQKSLQAAGAATYLRVASPPEVKKELDAFIQLHEMRWKAKGGNGVFHQPRYTGFHREICRIFSQRGWVTLDFLLLNGEQIAGIYGYVYGGKYSFYLPGFNPDILPKASPGKLLLFHRIREAIDEGCKQVDLLRGTAPYKMAWATGLRQSLMLRHYNRTPRAALLKLVDSGKQIAKVALR